MIDHDARESHIAPTFAGQSGFAATITLFSLLLSVDLGMFGVHALHAWTPWLNAGHFSIEADRGFAEVYQYLKEFWIVVCFAGAFCLTRVKAFAGWALVFAFLLFDDAAQLHERTGAWLGSSLGLPAIGGLRPDDFGEILFAGFVGSIIFVAAGYGLLRGDPRARRSTVDMLLLVAALAVFGVVVDAAHVIAYFRAPAFSSLLALVEDGGEMIVMTAIVCYAFDIVTNQGHLRFDLWSAARRVFGPRQPANPAATRS